MPIAVFSLDANRREDFFRLHHERNEHGWCFCVAWWVESFAGWGERSSAENRALREAVFDRGEYDGYLLYVGDEPAGWCQCGPRDRLGHLCRRYDLEADHKTWAISCFFIAPKYRRQGLARHLLEEVITDLRNRGVERVQAFPLREAQLQAEDLWKGPEIIFQDLGFFVVREDKSLPVYELPLQSK